MAISELKAKHNLLQPKYVIMNELIEIIKNAEEQMENVKSEIITNVDG